MNRNSPCQRRCIKIKEIMKMIRRKEKKTEYIKQRETNFQGKRVKEDVVRQI